MNNSFDAVRREIDGDVADDPVCAVMFFVVFLAGRRKDGCRSPSSSVTSTNAMYRLSRDIGPEIEPAVFWYSSVRAYPSVAIS